MTINLHPLLGPLLPFFSRSLTLTSKYVNASDNLMYSSSFFVFSPLSQLYIVIFSSNRVTKIIYQRAMAIVFNIYVYKRLMSLLFRFCFFFNLYFFLFFT